MHILDFLAKNVAELKAGLVDQRKRQLYGEPVRYEAGVWSGKNGNEEEVARILEILENQNLLIKPEGFVGLVIPSCDQCQTEGYVQLLTCDKWGTLHSTMLAVDWGDAFVRIEGQWRIEMQESGWAEAGFTEAAEQYRLCGAGDVNYWRALLVSDL